MCDLSLSVDDVQKPLLYTAYATPFIAQGGHVHRDRGPTGGPGSYLSLCILRNLIYFYTPLRTSPVMVRVSSVHGVPDISAMPPDKVPYLLPYLIPHVLLGQISYR